MAKTRHIKRGCEGNYSAELALKICEQVALGVSIRKIAKMDGMPEFPAIYQWLAKHEEFAKMYGRAKEQMVLVMGEELLEIVDDESIDIIVTKAGKLLNHTKVNRDRLRAETRKWLMGKLMPHKYGEAKANKPDEADEGLKIVVKGGLPNPGDA